ncbi:nitrate reductase molybdenum cofactor assembly chaperone [Chrysiogenes arsenatis]|uniref:nitrate reductase molybdenum cofactor assembly chaperone n=1 Tax=Chrysiogenes arsenatis TaxID=309797 RepID=UPI000411AD5E|nr:molecular chaperone TorD family protein [Chrysiogenes arsenatis]
MREPFLFFSTLLSYPTMQTLAEIQNYWKRAVLSPESLELLAPFQTAMSQEGLAGMQECYTAAFDLQPLCAPYVAYQLCGDDARRGQFLIRLQQLYRSVGFAAEGELADHLSIVLHFLAEAPASEAVSDLQEDGLKPAVATMTGLMAGGNNPYGCVLAALEHTLNFSVTTTKELHHV